MSETDTQEMLKPETTEVVQRYWLKRMLGFHAHCYHQLGPSSDNIVGRYCCHCGQKQHSRLIPAPSEHGRHLNEWDRKGVTMIWSEWETERSYDY